MTTWLFVRVVGHCRHGRTGYAVELPVRQWLDELDGNCATMHEMTDHSIDATTECTAVGYVDGHCRLVATRDFEIEDHILLLEGEIVEFRSDADAPITRKKGDVIMENLGLTHWWINKSGKQVKVLVVDVPDLQE